MNKRHRGFIVSFCLWAFVLQAIVTSGMILPGTAGPGAVLPDATGAMVHAHSHPHSMAMDVSHHNHQAAHGDQQSSAHEDCPYHCGKAGCSGGSCLKHCATSGCTLMSGAMVFAAVPGYDFLNTSSNAVIVSDSLRSPAPDRLLRPPISLI